jgi:hypothetical protein
MKKIVKNALIAIIIIIIIIIIISFNIDVTFNSGQFNALNISPTDAKTISI